MNLREWCIENNRNDLLLEWDESNEKIPIDYAPKSSLEVYWKCKLGHIYSSKIIDRTKKGYGCPYCSNHRVLKGFNDLASQRPNLVKEWDYLNNNKKPEEVIYTSHDKYKWICDKGHSYIAAVRNRSNGRGCPICVNLEILMGYNDFESQNPELMKEWNFEKNDKLGIKPTDITAKSAKKVWWKCEKDGYEWFAKVENRVNGQGCPVCANKVVVKGVNDLATTHPNIAKMYHPKKNNKSVYEITYGSPQKYWWVCEKGHEWESSPNMLSRGKGCPHCSNHISIPQAVLYLSVNKKFKNTVQLYRINKTEFDIFIPELNLLIEYDGWIWHKDRHDFDLRKEKLAQEKGYNFLRVWEYKEKDNIQAKSNRNILYYNVTKGYDYKYLCELFYMYLNKFYNLNISTNMKYTSNEIELIAREYRAKYEKENSIAITHPEIAKEWHPIKNGKLKPEHISYGTNLKVWWLCPNGHTYDSNVSARTGKNYGCPICSGRRRLVGFNDLTTTHPHLLEEWDYEKNIKSPTEYSKGSEDKVFWKCKEGHSYQASIYSRAQLNSSCPECYKIYGRKKIKPGINDIATTCPELLRYWDYSRNEKSPKEVGKGSQDKYYWIDNGVSYYGTPQKARRKYKLL